MVVDAGFRRSPVAVGRAAGFLSGDMRWSNFDFIPWRAGFWGRSAGGLQGCEGVLLELCPENICGAILLGGDCSLENQGRLQDGLCDCGTMYWNERCGVCGCLPGG